MRSHKQRISAQVLGQIVQPYFCPGPHDANPSQAQGTRSLHLTTKDMLHQRTNLYPGSIALLCSFRQLLVGAAFALGMFPNQAMICV